MRVALYLRQSLDRSGEALGIARQEAECRRLCEYREWEIVEVIRDNDRSATVGVRPGYAQLRRLIESGAIDVVVVLRIDRLLRKMVELEELIDLSEKTGVTIATVEGDVNLQSIMGRQMARIMASIARGEVETKSARHRLANEQRAKAGLPHKGRRAYGYQADGLTINEDEALIFKDIAHKFLSGWTYTELADWLNEQGYKTAMGNKFYSVAIRQMLMRVRYKGVREHDGIEYPAAWPAILDEDTFQMVQHRIKERSASIGFRPMAKRHLLTGFLFCGSCGATMNGTTTYDRKTKEPRKTYRCNRQRLGSDGKPGCGKVSRGAVVLDWWIKELIIYRLDSPGLRDLIGAGHDMVIQPLLDKRATLEAKMAELLDAFTDGTITKLEYKRAKARAQRALDDVETKIMALHQSETMNGLLSAGESVKERWETESDGWRRSLIGMLIESITIEPSRKLPRIQIEGKTFYFNSEAVQVKWRA